MKKGHYCWSLIPWLLSILFLPAVPSLGAPIPTVGGLLRFDNSVEFRQAFPFIYYEGFNDSPVSGGVSEPCDSPIDSTTNQACFSPGDIIEGISFDAEPSHRMAALSAGYSSLTTTTPSLAAIPLASQMVISFPGEGRHAVAMDLISLNDGTLYQVEVYGEGGVLLDTIITPGTTVSGTFFGIFSTQPIIEIRLDNGSLEIVDNVRFGGIPREISYYSGRPHFEQENPGLVREDFEETPVEDGNFLFINEPLNSTSEIPNGFSAGDIVEGLSLGTVAKPGGDALVIVGNNFGQVNNSSKNIATRSNSFDLEISFREKNTYAVGMDLMVSAPHNQAQIVIYGANNKILNTKTIQVTIDETFLGFYSRYPIGGVAVINGGAIEFVDNIQFGGNPHGVTFFTDEADLRKTAENFTFEDFSKNLADPSQSIGCDVSFDSKTDNDCFAPGGIAYGVSFSPQYGFLCPTCIYAHGEEATCPGAGKTISAYSGMDIMRIDFNERTHYTGIYLINNEFYAHIYGEDDNLLGVGYVHGFGCGGGFWGVKSEEPISYILLGEQLALVYLDKIMFGQKYPWNLMLPSLMGE